MNKTKLPNRPLGAWHNLEPQSCCGSKSRLHFKHCEHFVSTLRNKTDGRFKKVQKKEVEEKKVSESKYNLVNKAFGNSVLSSELAEEFNVPLKAVNEIIASRTFSVYNSRDRSKMFN